MQDSVRKPYRPTGGFTLVELAIVLVIVALIVGGVLVGQDLIKAATIRAGVSQIEKYDGAANTFRNKYNALPGDLTNPSAFFPAVTTTTGERGLADGNGLIETINAVGPAGLCGGITCISGEGVIFWYELAQAGLIADPITTSDAADLTLTPDSTVLPAAKVGLNGKVAVQAASGHNYWVIDNFGTAALGNGFGTYLPPFTPIEAFQLDTKMDDGVPGTGRMLSISPYSATPNQPWASQRAKPRCASSTASSGEYSTTTNADIRGCSAGIRASF